MIRCLVKTNMRIVIENLNSMNLKKEDIISIVKDDGQVYAIYDDSNINKEEENNGKTV